MFLIFVDRKQLVIAGLRVRQLLAFRTRLPRLGRGERSGRIRDQGRVRHRSGAGRHRRATGQRERGVVGSLHAHRRRRAQLVGKNRGVLGGPTHQEDIPRGEGLVAEPGHQGIDGRCGVGARHRRDGHHRRRRVRVTNHR